MPDDRAMAVVLLALLLAGALCLGLLLVVPVVGAQIATWRDVRAGAVASWWGWDGCQADPVVLVEGGEGGGECIDGQATVWAQGQWTRVTVDGAVLAERWRVALPEVSR